MRQGVPQGGILSPTLFNLYMTGMPTPPDNIIACTYADDTTALNSGPIIPPLCAELNIYLEEVNEWFKGRNLQISASKSSATLFTTFSNEMSLELPIYIDGEKVPTINDPKILGVTLDPQLSFKTHTKDLKSKISKRNNVLRALSGSSWGKDKETLVTTFKATSQSLLNYCCPIFTPTLSDSNWNELQIAQNAGLRTSLGCVKMASKDHIHSETKIMPVKDHCQMISKQFLLSTTKPDHPNHRNLDETIPRLMKPTLRSAFKDDIKQHIPQGGSTLGSYKAGLKSIHTESVGETIRNQAANPVLQRPAPPVNPAEKTLPRKTRVTLTQLRSSYSSHLYSYLNRINENKYPSPNCKDCNLEPHTTTHLFKCPKNPTTLDPTSLWEEPVLAAEFLGLETRDGVG